MHSAWDKLALCVMRRPRTKESLATGLAKCSKIEEGCVLNRLIKATNLLLEIVKERIAVAEFFTKLSRKKLGSFAKHENYNHLELMQDSQGECFHTPFERTLKPSGNTKAFFERTLKPSGRHFVPHGTAQGKRTKERRIVLEMMLWLKKSDNSSSGNSWPRRRYAWKHLRNTEADNSSSGEIRHRNTICLNAFEEYESRHGKPPKYFFQVIN